MKKQSKTYLTVSVLLVLLFIWSIVFSFFSPEEIIEIFGIRNGYLFLFFLSAIAGVSTLTSTSFYLALVTFVLGGLHPLLLGICVGAGVTIGDTFYYYLGCRSAELSSGTVGKFEKKRYQFAFWIAKQPQWSVLLFTFLYCGFIPLPTDILAVALGFSGYSYKKIFWPLLFGNIFYGVAIGYLALHGISFFM